MRVVDGELSIGPERNGPAMAYGGPSPTPTDALFVLGRAQNGDARRISAGFCSLLPINSESPSKQQHAEFWIFVRKDDFAAREMIERHQQQACLYGERIAFRLQGQACRNPGARGSGALFCFRLAKLTGLPTSAVPHGMWLMPWGGHGQEYKRSNSFRRYRKGDCTGPGGRIQPPGRQGFRPGRRNLLAFDLLREKCLKAGASESELDMEVVEDTQFNMVRGFYTCRAKHSRKGTDQARADPGVPGTGAVHVQLLPSARI